MTNENHLDAVDRDTRIDQLVDEFTDRLNLGEQPDVESYVQNHPDIAVELRQLLRPLIALRIPAQETPPLAGRVTALDAKTLGDYRIVREIGRGGMAVVYEAVHQHLQRRVALKVLTGQQIGDQLLQRFEREGRAAANLHHTHIVPVYETGQCAGVHFIAMQYIAGVSLDKLVAQRRAAAETPERNNEEYAIARLPVGEYIQNIARLGEQAAEALAHAHERGVLHRDIKPSNLLLDMDGNAWVTDFGLAKTTEADLSRPGDIVGTLRYMAPERFRGECDRRSDVYGLGVTLYELLTLCPAFPELDRLHLMRQIGNTAPMPPRTWQPAIPRPLQTIVHKAIAKAPADRYASADALAEDLRRFLAGRPILARRITWPEHLWLWSRRNPTLATTLFALLIVLVMGLTTVTWLWRGAEFYRRQAEQRTVEVSRQREETARQRDQAVAQAKQTRDTIQHFLVKVATNPHMFEKGFEKLRAELLTIAGRYAHDLHAQLPNDPELRVQTLDTHRVLADVLVQLGDEAKAIQILKDTIAAHEELQGTPAYRPRELARCSAFCGELMMWLDQPEQAKAYLDKAVRLLRQQHKDHPKEQRLTADLARTLDEAAGVLLRAGLLKEAEQHLAEAQSLRQTLDSTDKSHASARPMDLAWSRIHHGMLLRTTGKYDEAEQTLQGALHIFDTLRAAHPTMSRRYLQAVGHAHMQLGSVYSLMGHYNKSEQHYLQAKAQFALLADRHPDLPAYHHRLATIDYRLGLIRMLDGRLPQAEETLLANQNDIKALQKRFAGFHKQFLELEAGNHNVLAGLRRQQGKLEEARRLQEEAVRLYLELVALSPKQWHYVIDLGMARNNLGNTFLKQGKIVEALPHYQRGIKHLKRVLQQQPSHQAARDHLSKGLSGLGACFVSLKRYDDALPLCTAIETHAPDSPEGDGARRMRIILLVRLGRHAQTYEPLKQWAVGPHIKTASQSFRLVQLVGHVIRQLHDEPPAGLLEKERETLSKQLLTLGFDILTSARQRGFLKQPSYRRVLQTDPDLEPLRQWPRFREIFEKE